MHAHSHIRNAQLGACDTPPPLEHTRSRTSRPLRADQAPLARPRAGVGAYALLCACDAFAASGFGYVAAACLPPASAQLGALSVALLFAMFSGVHPTLAAMPAALKVVHYASHDRYFVEALFVEEVARMSEAFRLPPTFYADASSSAPKSG